MKTKLLRKFRKRFQVRWGQDGPILIDLQALKVHYELAPKCRLQTLSDAIVLGVSKLVSFETAWGYIETRRKRIIRKLL